jgi:hypothetical protein
MRVKLIWASNYSDYDDYYSSNIIKAGTEWEEVTAEELELLNTHAQKLTPPFRNYQPIILVETSAPEALRSIREHVELLKKREEERAQKRRESMKRIAAAKRAKKQKQLAELLKELGHETNNH